MSQHWSTRPGASRDSIHSMHMGAKIKGWLVSKGLDQVDLLHMTNRLIPKGEDRLTKQTLSALILRASVRSKYAPFIAQAMGVELASLVTKGVPLKPIREPENSSTADGLGSSGARAVGYNRATVPVITMAEAAEMCMTGDLDLAGNPRISVGFLGAEPGAGSFAVELEGDSMEAPSGLSFPAGTIVVIDPNRQPKTGDFVLVLDAPGSATLKQLVVDGSRRYLATLNPRYPLLEWRDDFMIAGTACGYHGKL